MKFRFDLKHPATAYVIHSALICFGYGLTAPTYAPFLLKAGLTLAEVPLINAFFFGVATLMELPTGMWADGKSRLWSMRLGTAIGAFSMFGYATASGFWSAVGWESLNGLANAFLSGASAAWLADALHKRGEKESLRRAFGTTTAVSMAASLVGGIIGANVGAFSFILVWFIAGGSHLLALAVTAIWMRADGEPPERLTETQALAASFRALNVTPGLRWAIAACVVFGLALPFNYYWSPFFQERVGISGLGWIWAAIYGINALGGLAVRSWKTRWGSDGVVIPICLVLAGIGLAGVGIFGGLAVPIGFVLIHEFGRGAFSPLVDSYVQARVESRYRATFGSLQSFIGRGGYVFVLIAVWASTHQAGGGTDAIPIVWLICGSLLVAAAALLWLFRPR